MNKTGLPHLTVLIATYNEEKRIEACLNSVVSQEYPKDKIEIVVVDDKSEDKTVDLVKKYTDKIYYSGRHFCEISRAMGIHKASHDLVFFIDGDNILPNDDFLINAVEPFLQEKDLVGSFPFRFHYDKNDPPSNRYCALFGINEPFQYYSKAREHLSYFEDAWVLQGDSTDKDKYYLVEFSKGSLLTLGAIGFLGRKDLMLGEIKEDFFFHSDAYNNLINQGHNKYAVVKQTVIHNHCSSSKQFFKKLLRNFKNFLMYKDQRDENWATGNKGTFILNVFLMTTFIVPLVDSIRGYMRIKDVAWFYHPFYCLGVVCMYSYATIKHALFGKV